MKLSKGYITTAFQIREKSTGKKYDCFIQEYEHYNGLHETRFNIGINGWNGWNFLYYLDEETFNEEMEII